MKPWQFDLFILGQLLLGALYLVIIILAIALVSLGMMLLGARFPLAGAILIVAVGYQLAKLTDRRAVRRGK